MKNIVRSIVLVSLLGISPLAAFSEEITVTVKGMVCSFCAQGIKKTFGKIDNVKSVDVDLESKVVKLDVKDGKAMNDDDLKKLIVDAGYEVQSIERK
jgi:copper chaperone CopZ